MCCAFCGRKEQRGKGMKWVEFCSNPNCNCHMQKPSWQEDLDACMNSSLSIAKNGEEYYSEEDCRELRKDIKAFIVAKMEELLEDAYDRYSPLTTINHEEDVEQVKQQIKAKYLGK